MKTGQLYRLAMSTENAANARIGNMVFLSDESDEVIGFIDNVDHASNSMDLCLFQQSPNIIDEAIIIEEKLSPQDVQVLFARVAASADRDVLDEWTKDAIFVDYSSIS